MSHLFYTISTPDKNALQCSSLLHESLKQTYGDDTELRIVGVKGLNYPATPNLQLVDRITPEWGSYICDLKYSAEVFSGYDHFTYVDSDILWYKALPVGKKYIQIDDHTPYTLWYTQYFDDVQNKPKYYYNAGIFSFDIETANRVARRCEILCRRKTQLDEPAPKEQSMFSRAMYLESVSMYTNIAPYVVLFADGPCVIEDKIYHFCGFSGSMDTKIVRMKRFLGLSV